MHGRALLLPISSQYTAAHHAQVRVKPLTSQSLASSAQLSNLLHQPRASAHSVRKHV